MLKLLEKQKAITLRRSGLSYSEIRSAVKVSKSTLSLWLRSVDLAKRQRQRLTEKKLASAKKGWTSWQQQRIDFTKEIKRIAKSEVGLLSDREWWLVGVALYWAEGSKERAASIGHQTTFSNSDPLMIRVFLRWLREVIKIDEKDLVYEIYIHESLKDNANLFKEYWAKVANVKEEEMSRVYLKKNKLSNKIKAYSDYYGQLRIRVRRSSTLTRKIAGWTEGIVENCGVV